MVSYFPTTKYFQKFLKLIINMIWHMLKHLHEENGSKYIFTVDVRFKKLIKQKKNILKEKN